MPGAFSGKALTLAAAAGITLAAGTTAAAAQTWAPWNDLRAQEIRCAYYYDTDDYINYLVNRCDDLAAVRTRFDWTIRPSYVRYWAPTWRGNRNEYWSHHDRNDRGGRDRPNDHDSDDSPRTSGSRSDRK